MTTLNDRERLALQLTSEALTTIRRLATRPITREGQQAIHDLADAFHNIPALAAGGPESRDANRFLLDHTLADAPEVYRRHGLTSHHIKL